QQQARTQVRWTLGSITQVCLTSRGRLRDTQTYHGKYLRETPRGWPQFWRDISARVTSYSTTIASCSFSVNNHSSSSNHSKLKETRSNPNTAQARLQLHLHSTSPPDSFKRLFGRQVVVLTSIHHVSNGIITPGGRGGTQSWV